MNNFWRIRISSVKNGCNSIGIEKGEYPVEEVESAIEKIKQFCSKTDITIESYGRGYDSLKIKMENGIQKTYGLTPYGIDIQMMLTYIDECTSLVATANQGISGNPYAQFQRQSSQEESIGAMEEPVSNQCSIL